MRQSNSFIYINIAAIIEDRSRLAKNDALHKTNTKLLVEWNQANDQLDKLEQKIQTMEVKAQTLQSEKENSNGI